MNFITTTYKNIALIILRITALSFVISALLDFAIAMSEILLVSIGKMSEDRVVTEGWLLQATAFFIGGVIVYARARSLSAYVVDALFEDQSSEKPK